MAVLSPLRVAEDLRRQATEIEPVRPDVAAAIREDTSRLVDAMGTLSVAEVAEELQQSQPTIRTWVRKGYLPAQSLGGKMRIAAGDLVQLVGILDLWRAEGGHGRPSTFIRQWAERELQAQQELRRIGRTRIAANGPVVWPGGVSVR